MIKLTQEREIAPYVWVHPDEDDRRLGHPRVNVVGNRRLFRYRRLFLNAATLIMSGVGVDGSTCVVFLRRLREG
jgi:hypothetical protein